MICHPKKEIGWQTEVKYLICHPKMEIGWQMEEKYLICHLIGVRRTVAWLVETELGGKYGNYS